jgi:hypothetical protein
MTLRRTPLLPPGRGLGRPSRSSIGASTAARAAGGGAGLLLDGGRGSAALQIAFCQLPPFVMICTGVVATPVEADWWLSPLPIVESLPSTERICDGSRDRLDSWELQLVRGRGLSAPLSYHAFRQLSDGLDGAPPIALLLMMGDGMSLDAYAEKYHLHDAFISNKPELFGSLLSSFFPCPFLSRRTQGRSPAPAWSR